MDKLSYHRHRFPSIVIQQAIWLYFRFALSYRDVEDVLAERGIDVSYETLRRWALKFGAIIARKPRQRSDGQDYGECPDDLDERREKCGTDGRRGSPRIKIDESPFLRGDQSGFKYCFSSVPTRIARGLNQSREPANTT